MKVPEQLELFPGTDANEASSKSGRNQPVESVREAGKRFGPSKIGKLKSPGTLCGGIPKNSTVPFPADRQIAHVRRIARALDGRDERLAAKYWGTERNRLIVRLQVQGFDAATIRAEVVRFGNAVAQHRVNDGRQRPTGGAA